MKTLKRWQEPIYALGGFGPGFMYQIVMTYLLYYYLLYYYRLQALMLLGCWWRASWMVWWISPLPPGRITSKAVGDADAH